MDDRFKPRPLARWFTPAALVALLFGLLLVFRYGIQLSTDPATLPLDERAIYLAEPSWVSGAFGLTGAATAVGALLLLMRRKAADRVMLVALAAAVVWFAGLLLVPQLRELLTSEEIALAVVVVVIVWTIFWFARHSRMRGWLR